MKGSTALVLSGGGARAAYQVGVLKAVSNILHESKRLRAASSPFDILTGFSAGAINIGCLAAGLDAFAKTTDELWTLWENITPDEVFRADILNVAGNGAKWLAGLVFGGGPNTLNHLLNTDPMVDLISRVIDFKRLENNLESGVLKGVAISATNYNSGGTVTFFQGEEIKGSRQESLYRTVRTKLKTEHILASCAIPVLFPPVKVDHCYYGDGGIRFSTPLSPAIHMGAERIFAVGIRHSKNVDPCSDLTRKSHPKPPALAEVLGVLLNSIFAETLASDTERATRINEVVDTFNPNRRPSRFRDIPILSIEPSIDLGDLAFKLYRKFPIALKYVLHGIGASQQRGWDFLSYLAFDQSYTSRLLRLGYDDAVVRGSEILDFFEVSRATTKEREAQKSA